MSIDDTSGLVQMSRMADHPGNAHMAIALLMQIRDERDYGHTNFAVLMMLDALAEDRKFAIMRELTENGFVENIEGKLEVTDKGREYLNRPIRSSFGW